MRTVLLLGLAATVALIAPPLRPCAAQQGSAVLIVSVRNAGSGAPLPSAQVRVEELGLGGVTDTRGLLRLDGIPAGRQRVSVESVGFARQEAEVEVIEGNARGVSFVLALRVVELPGVEAYARGGMRRLAQSGFYDRRALGIGRFVTRQQIEQRQPRRMSDVLRTLPGVHLSPMATGDARATMRRSSMATRACPIQYFVDGAMTSGGFNIDDVHPQDVEGIEVYYGASQIPAQFNRRTALCGVILIWTRID